MSKTHFSGKDQKPPQPSPPRAGLRPDERDPDEPPGASGSATGGIHAAGSGAGGMAGGGLGGTNAADGSNEDPDIEDSLGSSLADRGGEDDENGPPYSGQAGGAVGGTPAGKRATGG